MIETEMKDIISNVAGIVGILSVIILPLIIIYKKNILKDNQNRLTESFDLTVSKLSSSITSEKYSAAILLRRYFDRKSSYGIGGIPLANETLNVICSMLKIHTIDGGLQKLLADSLKYAPNLIKADFQETNLSKAVLGKKGLDITGADFYRANLTGASFKDNESEEDGVILKDAVFRGAILHNTNFSGADLTGANFKGANFKNTNFDHCKNPPPIVLDYINNEEKPDEKKKCIFISHPRIQTIEQQIVFDSICNEVEKDGTQLKIMERISDKTKRLSSFVKEINKCSGMIVFDFKQYKVLDGEHRWWNEKESKKLSNVYFSSRWVYIEAGMGIMNDMPIYVITDLSDNECIFSGLCEENIIKINNFEYKKLIDINKKIKGWINSY